jgi:hypothetical protein
MLRVAEQENGRLSVFDPDAGFVRSFPLQLFTYGSRGPWVAAVDSTGRTMVVSSGRYGEGRSWNMLRVYDPSMRQIDSIPYDEYTNEIGDSDDPPWEWRIAVGSSTLHIPVPYFAQPRQVVGPAGELWTTPQGATQLEVARWMPPGDTSLIILSLRPPVPVTPGERDAAMAEVRSRLEDMLPGPPSLDPAKIPAVKPPSHGLSLDDRGRLWVRVTDERADTTIYDLFEPDGRYSGTLALPFWVDPVIPPTLRGERVWAVVTDASDVQYVVRARVTVPLAPIPPAPTFP